jgi:hypothetical protein
MGASPSLKVSASLLSTNPQYNKHICIVINTSLINLSILFQSFNTTTLACFSLNKAFMEVRHISLLKSRHSNYPAEITGGLVIGGNLSLCGGIRVLVSHRTLHLITKSNQDVFGQNTHNSQKDRCLK